MAKRRKKPAAYRRRRKSIGATAGSVITEIAGIAAGAVLAKQLNKMLKFDARILAAGKVALGVALPKFAKSPIMKGVGTGMIAIGSTELIGSFIPALGATDDVVLLSGADDVMMLNGLDEIGQDISEVNGLDEIGQDISEVNGLDEIGSDMDF